MECLLLFEAQLAFFASLISLTNLRELSVNIISFFMLGFVILITPEWVPGIEVGKHMFGQFNMLISLLCPYRASGRNKHS
jgi:hypothetical protein